MPEAFEAETGTVTLIPSDGGRFEVVVNGDPLFSKPALMRRADAGEIVELV